MSDLDAYRDVFLAESADFLQQITDGLLALESDATDLAPVEVVFRGAHSLKGMAAAMGYERTADLTHKMEGLMDRVRKEELSADTSLVSLMLAAVDLTRDLIDDDSNGKGDIDPSEMIHALEEMTSRSSEAAVLSPPESPTYGEDTSTSDAQGGGTRWRVTVTLDESCVLKAVRAYMVIKRLNHMGHVAETIPSAREIEDERFEHEFQVLLDSNARGEALHDAVMHVSEVAHVTVSREAVESAPEEQSGAAQPPSTGEAARHSRRVPKLSETQTVRVSIGHLDNLVDLVGELVILRSRLERYADVVADGELAETIDELQRISTDLQYEVMQTRMVPVGNIFNRFPRMVRDLAIELGKQVEFEMDGLGIELDRTVLDEIGDPLVHLLRNSIDHGVERAEQRAALGKPQVGTIRLEASRERDHVAIVVSDDGKGIDADRMWGKAVDMGLVQQDERAEYSESDILLLACVPGFTTAEKATKVSGRGVGMDVVKGKIEHLGGTLEIRSRPGQGTAFVLRLPMTLAIVQALLLRCEGQMFALPLSSVDEVVATEDVSLDTVDSAPVVILRDGTIVPLHRLDALLFGADPHVMPSSRSSIVIMRSGADTHALSVDGIAGRREIVVKPLSRLFRDTKGFSGATILGDGRVLLIIDPRSVFHTQEHER